MDIIEMAREAGLQILLDARIGSQTYHSVAGSLTALQRFADAVEAEMRERSPRPRIAVRPHARLPRHAVAMRLRKRARNCRDRRERGADSVSVIRVEPMRHRSPG